VGMVMSAYETETCGRRKWLFYTDDGGSKVTPKPRYILHGDTP
jgi:hypothetical protein